MGTRLDGRTRPILGALVALVLFAAAPAQAQAGTAALCTVTFPSASITPPFQPLVLTPGTGTVTTGGETGTVSCLGEIGGDRVTGPGTAGVAYTYSNGTCVSHVGSGTANWTVPTEAGVKHLTGTLSVLRIGLSVLAEVRFPYARADVAGGLVPLEGDCLLTALRAARVIVAGPLVGT